MGKHPSLLDPNEYRSEWEQKDRETYSARELLQEYREALYTDKGLELISDTQPADE